MDLSKALGDHTPGWPGPPQAGWPGQPPQAGWPGQPPQPGWPGQPPQVGQPGQPPQPGWPGQPPQVGQPGQPPQPGWPGQPPQVGQPGQPPQPGWPGQPPQVGQPGQPPQPGWPGQPPQVGWPSTPGSGSGGGGACPGQTDNHGSGGAWPSQPKTQPSPPLKVPYSQSLNDVSDKVITIMGTVNPNAKKITLDMHAGNDLAFHFNPRFNDEGKKVIVRNSRICNKWGKEERDCPCFPFTQGQPFEIKILCTNTEFKVAVNNSHLLTFSHRVRDLRTINSFNIYNDVTLSKVTVK
ncbi:galectin-3b [Labrus mixtus]|uniref:galectin-3b n=1 Tax=Labrus mixtus TaxID=508554 RepID=UPI0029BFCA5F|nr:galectin-3b [Labrus mixtus]